MGFHRTRQPEALDRAGVTAALVRFIGEQEIAQVLREADPFGADDPCPLHSGGHQPHASCGEVVCVHCARIFWR